MFFQVTILAAQCNSTEVAQLLADKGADIKLKDIFNKTSLDWARGELKRLLEVLQLSAQ